MSLGNLSNVSIELQQVLHDVANAPSMNASRIAAMYQLDFMNPKTAALAKLDDIGIFRIDIVWTQRDSMQ